ncbi:lebercilin-like [Adelges cooleyi]|uniref:lebercilin-like n=1 Tax=Adelges cooleyi TaxID=133065 RepID=UPI00217FE725|nr:lebercilin-like [Adelges cooleyi]
MDEKDSKDSMVSTLERSRSNLQFSNNYSGEIIDEYVKKLPVFNNKKPTAVTRPQCKKKTAKPIPVHTLSATRRQCVSNLPYKAALTGRIGSHQSNCVKNLLCHTHTLKIKQLENEINESRMQCQGLITENRLLKTMEKRQEHALSLYEGAQAKLPQMIKSFSEDIRMLKSQLKQMKSAYKELENRYRSQSTELLIVQKQHKHLLDLSKNKHLTGRDKLSKQLADAQNTLLQQEKKIENLMKKLELQSKTHQHQISSELNKNRDLHVELKRLNEMNEQLSLQIEKSKSHSYGARSVNVRGITENPINLTPRTAKMVVARNTLRGNGDNNPSELPYKKSVHVIESSHGTSGDSDVSIRSMQSNLTNQKTGIVIQSPDKLNSRTAITNSSVHESLLFNNGINKLVKDDEKILLQMQSSLMNQNETKNSGSTFATPETSLSRAEKDLLLAKLNNTREEKKDYNNKHISNTLIKPTKNFYQPAGSDDVSSISSTSRSSTSS